MSETRLASKETQEEIGYPGREASAPSAPPHRNIVILTGMSGAGKALAARCFEDLHYRVVDNLPPRLLPLVAVERDVEEVAAAEAARDGDPAFVVSPLCLVCDVRGGRIEDLLPALELLQENGERPVLLFLDASDESLVRRFKETRRTHPLFLSAGGILPSITRERELLAPIKERADKVIDTSGMTPTDLRQTILEDFAAPEQRQHPLTVTVASFGFKHGTPLDADLLFDVRFLRNPHYVDALRPFDGRDPAVEKYVMADDRTAEFLDRLYDLVGWSLPHYVSEGKAYLTIGIGCTGGKHRSVVVAEKLSRFLRERGYRVVTQHRDAHRDRRSGPEGRVSAAPAPAAPLAPQEN